jgi:hypothetical protein
VISYELYKVIHLVGVVAVFAALGGAALLAIHGGAAPGTPARRATALMHAAGLLLVLVAGFGLVARLDLFTGGMPMWVAGKLGVWFLAGIALTIPRRRPSFARPMLFLGLPLLAAAAAWLAVYKPGN